MPRGGGKSNRLFGGQSSTSCMASIKTAPFTVKKISQGWGWGNGGGKATAVMPHGGGGGGGGSHWAMDNSPTRPQVGGGGLIIDRCING